MRAPRSTILRHGLFFAVLAIALIAVTYLLDAFTNYNIAGVAIFAIAAAGLTVLTGINGQLSLGHGALMAVGAYTTGLLLKINPDFPFILTLLASVATTAVAGAIIGVAAARLRGPYLAGATLALAVGLPQLAIHFGSVLGGNQGLNVASPTAPAALGGDFPQERWLAWIAIVAAALTLFLLANLVRGGAGRTLRAVHDNETAARLVGIDVARVQVLAFLISAACAGLAGSLFAYWVGITAPTGFGLQLSLQLLSAIVIGGLGSLAGAVWGAIVLVYLPVLTSGLSGNLNLSSDISNNLPLAVYGAVLVLAMLVLPRGIQGTLAALARAGRQWLTRRRLYQRTAEADI
ncbi:MAG: branched-chain amino acid ABC transporter permease [Candidatus Dormibacteraeota bacterium]|uniref:Branched-chain amino acid ABC transporter permease n=1 Tax=Candidatus Aeolococcus gillhamiae TaxID=3127015 RepID=A0A2W5ZJM7_9BACT|nr:branched-chain amino acid ABC transporter permease [Candidatus Dormibacteraeota bacterium]PZR84097.1 MAG: branched-chain amino acid ABC transporter permease [Candidatus Dormibacter sp. RRmetagenome_bin12]